MKKILLTFGSALFLGIVASYAQDTAHVQQFDAGLIFRPRTEFRSGDFRPVSKTEKPAALTSDRLRLSFGYAYSDILKTKITFQNVGLWGQAAPIQGTTTSNNSVGIYEGWADLKLAGNLRTRIGRQEIVLDDQRLFSNTDWAQGGRSHDAVSVYYKNDRLDVRTYFAFNQNYAAFYQGNLNNPSGSLYNTDGVQSYKTMQTVWASLKLSKQSSASFLFSNLGLQNTSLTNVLSLLYTLQTTGMNYYLNGNTVQLKLSGYYQFGHNLQGQKVSAYLLSAGISGNIAPKLNVGVRSDYLSGNDAQQSNPESHVFSTLFGTGHPFYGQMDYYPYGNAGLWNNVLSAGLGLSKKMSLKAEGHLFFTAHDFEQNGITYGSNIGQELDLNFNYAIAPFASFNMGYSVYFTNGNIAALKGVSNQKSLQNWAWMSLNITPQIFKTRF